MPTFDDVTRAFWLPGLNEITGSQTKELTGWISDEDFQVYSPPGDGRFTLSVSYALPVVRAYAAEITRISTAAFETIAALNRPRKFPKSAGWLIIKTYYAAFFSAHAFLRMLGTSCSPLSREDISSITTVADAYGYAPSTPLPGGLHTLNFDASSNQLNGRVIRDMRTGPHEAFWLEFTNRMQSLSSNVLQTASATIKDRQIISAKLSDLVSNLCFKCGSKGCWLSMVRNAVNYGQSHYAWYPYGHPERYYDQLFDSASEWNSDPAELDLVSHQGRDLRRFQITCNFLIAMLRVSILEMARRCPRGRSFHTYGPMAFLNLFRQPNGADNGGERS